MSLEEAAQLSAILDTKDRLMDSEKMFGQNLGELVQINTAMRKSDHKGAVNTLISAAIGGALGFGIAKGVTSTMGLGEESSNKINTLGTLMGVFMGLNKSAAEDSLNAMRYGFLKKAAALGHFKKKAFNPFSIITDPLMGIASGAKSVGDVAGTAAGIADMTDETDVDIARMQIEKQMLQHELAKIKAKHDNEVLRKVLAKRKGIA